MKYEDGTEVQVGDLVKIADNAVGAPKGEVWRVREVSEPPVKVPGNWGESFVIVEPHAQRHVLKATEVIPLHEDLQ